MVFVVIKEAAAAYVYSDVSSKYTIITWGTVEKLFPSCSIMLSSEQLYLKVSPCSYVYISHWANIVNSKWSTYLNTLLTLFSFRIFMVTENIRYRNDKHLIKVFNLYAQQMGK